MPTKLCPRRRASSWASMTTLMAFSVKRSNIIRVGWARPVLGPAARRLRRTLLWKLRPAWLRLTPSIQPLGCSPEQEAARWLHRRQASRAGATPAVPGRCPATGRSTLMMTSVVWEPLGVADCPAASCWGPLALSPGAPWQCRRCSGRAPGTPTPTDSLGRGPRRAGSTDRTARPPCGSRAGGTPPAAGGAAWPPGLAR